MTRYAWGAAENDYPGDACFHRAKLIIDGKETRLPIDYVDTDTLEYRVLVRGKYGEYVLDGDDVKREMRKAKVSLEVVPL